MIRSRFILQILCVISTFTLSSCVETVVVGSAATMGFIVGEKSTTNSITDVGIATKVQFKLVEAGLGKPGNSVSASSTEGRVLLVGIVDSNENSSKATDIAWEVNGVSEVINEIEIKGEGFKAKNVSSNFFDSIITARIKTKIMFDKKIRSMNYKISTINGVVYVVGVAKNESELRKVMSISATVKGVSKVINHAILASDSRRG